MSDSNLNDKVGVGDIVIYSTATDYIPYPAIVLSLYETSPNKYGPKADLFIFNIGIVHKVTYDSTWSTPRSYTLLKYRKDRFNQKVI